MNKPPVLTLEIHAKDGSEYELEDEDIREVFARFGTVEKVMIRSNGKALIVFSEALNAAFALHSLNDHEIEDIEVRLKVGWCPASEIPAELYDQSNGTLSEFNPKTNECSKDLIKNQSNEKIEEKSQLNENFNNQSQFTDFDGSLKYTCRFEIQIDNEREFQICRKIIGPKGSNMKQIIEYCCQDKHEDYLYFQEQIKLRLRGKGSGYKEGINQIGEFL